MLIEALATARLTRVVVKDAITEPSRQWARENSAWLSELVECNACVSVWAAAGVAIAPRWVTRALAVSQIVLVAQWAKSAADAQVDARLAIMRSASLRADPRRPAEFEDAFR